MKMHLSEKFKLFPFLILLLLGFSQLGYAALPSVNEEGKPFPSLAPMIKQIKPAVVNISTYSTQKYATNPLLNDPFFRHFFNVPQQRQYPQQTPKKRQQSAGSGVIVNSNDGIIMTNYHVIKGADEVQVSLLDGRSYTAEVLGSDPDLDIAILEIDAKQLTQLKLADSNHLEVGDFVVAIGNPFGLGQTVTTGVVSALGRSGLGIEGYENFIQTDASINPGNSGGALVNLKGELVGINTAIIAPSGGNVGIGFAIPSNMAKASMEQIIEHGTVKRGQIGIGIQDLSAELRQTFELNNSELGVLVSSVVKSSPAEKAGLKAGDIILSVNGQPTKSTSQLRSQIGIKPIGEKVELTIWRNNSQKKLKVEVGSPISISASTDKLHPLLEGAQFENSEQKQGISVTNIQANSPAAYSGLRSGDLIEAVNRVRVTDLKSFKNALNKNEKSILLQINRRGRALFIVIQ